uniref:NADH dehydrogenase subunit 5 n=1 Tax=Allodiplogaster sp. MY-2022 TaxID=2938886 RepID=UPI00208F882E|nr:NADH dehydrogenase subunit 5 [Allodiplogaster sp. MY-2022]URY63367.1 NADH dehydrogenase subunit 5 [Allodiplogaster sp. MY-2022]
MNIFIYLIIMFFLSGFFVWVLPFFKVGLYLFEWQFLTLKFSFYFNSLLFSFILFLVTFSVLVYSTYYLSSELSFNYYVFVLLVFVCSMFSLNFSNNSFSMLLSWDLLGISSYFLVLFYNNWDSSSGSMNTALTNRLGDYFMFVFFGFTCFSSYYFISFSFFCFYILLFLVLTAFTKSAQFPFSSWLPKAMSAPTPVSSLVHSSTLVTAGLILLMNFNFLLFNKFSMVMLLVFGSFTMFFSSVSALLEEDMKKVVALSTLSQMGFSMLTLGLGLYFISFIHLVSHALFKSCLFMQVGYIIHCSFGQQDSRSYFNNGNFPIFMQLQLLITLFCLCGMIFSSGSVSKDFILELFYSNSYYIFFVFMFFLSVFLTFGYSYRVWKGFFLNFNNSISHFSSSFIMNFLSLILVTFSICFLWWFNFNMINTPSFFIYIDFFVPIFYILLMYFFIYFIWKLILKEFTYKFLVDFLANMSVFKMKNIKFMDLGLLNIISSSYSLFSYFNFNSNLILKNLNFSSLIVIIFLFFLLF